MTKPAHSQVLFLATIYGHLHQFHIPFMNSLQSKGFVVHAGASVDDRASLEKLERAGVVCWDIPFARSPYDPKNVKAFLRLRQLLSNEHFDLVHVHTPVASFLGRLLSKATHQGPVLYTAHGFHFYKGAPLKNWLVYYTAERVAARWTDALIVMNSEDYELAQRLGYRPGESLFRVHGVGVDLNVYSQPVASESIRHELGIGRDQPVVTCVAEFTDNKNQAFLLDAWAMLARRLGDGHLLFVGSGKNFDLLRNRADTEGIPRVHFLGYRTDVPQILLDSDIAVLVSKREGLPRSLMEAMASGKPVVATNVRGNRDLVEDGQTGLLIEPGDTASLASALERLLVDADLRKEMGSAGKARVQSFSLERVMEEMQSVYERWLRT